MKRTSVAPSLKVLWNTLSLLCVSSLCACTWMKPADKRVSETKEIIRNKYKKEVYRQKFKTNQGVLNTNWQSALNKMYLNNPELILADHRIEDAKIQQKQVWKDMVPGLNVGVSDSFQVGKLGDAFANPSLRINSFLSLGNLLDLPKNVYTRKLTYMGAELQAENTMRQQVITLYRLFQQQRLLKIEKKALDLEAQLIQAISDEDNTEIIQLKLRNDEAIEQWEKNYRYWKIKVGDFFMAGYDEIHLKHASLPDITYKPSQLDFTDSNRWGMLQLNLLALEQIADDGRVLDAYLRYLPRANLSVSAPSIYSNNSNQKFKIGDTRISPSLNWNLDSRGYIGQQIRRLKRESPLKEWRKDKRQRDEIQKLFEGKEALEKLQKELRTLRKAMAGYQLAANQGLLKDPKQTITTMRGLREREIRLAAREIEISTAFWLIDESRWRHITKRWLATRTARAKIRNNNIKRKSILKF